MFVLVFLTSNRPFHHPVPFPTQILFAKDLFKPEQRTWTVLPLNMTAMYACGSILATDTPGRFVAALKADNIVSETVSFTDRGVLGVLLIGLCQKSTFPHILSSSFLSSLYTDTTDSTGAPRVVDYTLLDSGEERRTADPVPSLTRINATALALITIAYDLMIIGETSCSNQEILAATVTLTPTSIDVPHAQCHALRYRSTSFQPTALDRLFDGKVLAVMPYNGFGTEFCGTKLFVAVVPSSILSSSTLS